MTRLLAPNRLTATELRIAELVAVGHRNRQVAEALAMRPKTVEWNLTRIYRKLGVRSRTELAARAAAADIAGEIPWVPSARK